MKKIYLALSCLQGRPMDIAFNELASFSPYGIQLTPGNAPTVDFERHVNNSKLSMLTHHGFCWTALRRPVWGGNGQCLVQSNSIHPPKESKVTQTQWLNILDNPSLPTLETMYPGYYLGNENDLEDAMAKKLSLAVDVSHVNIQLEQGVLNNAILKKLLSYSHINEIHVSANNGKRDQHRPIDNNTFGLSWAKEKAEDGTPIVIESYWHKLRQEERIEQLAHFK
ncbi:sugar phosphate isomerase/epimerase [bacterium]|nr:sugar phosphate isomerase/epimerase [bacterium]